MTALLHYIQTYFFFVNGHLLKFLQWVCERQILRVTLQTLVHFDHLNRVSLSFPVTVLGFTLLLMHLLWFLVILIRVNASVLTSFDCVFHHINFCYLRWNTESDTLTNYPSWLTETLSVTECHVGSWRLSSPGYHDAISLVSCCTGTINISFSMSIFLSLIWVPFSLLSRHKHPHINPFPKTFHLICNTEVRGLKPKRLRHARRRSENNCIAYLEIVTKLPAKNAIQPSFSCFFSLAAIFKGRSRQNIINCELKEWK